MRQTIEEAAREYWNSWLKSNPNIDKTRIVSLGFAFKAGADWQAKQSPWISVEERLPDEGQRVLVGFLYYYKYDDREAESRKHIDVFTYENGIWTTDSDISYRGKDVSEYDIKVICWMPILSFDEILEANRDVLERIKKKGD